MVGNLGIIENPRAQPHPAVCHGFIRGDRQARIDELAHGGPHDGQVVLGQVAAVGTRVGKHLVLFVELLSNLQGSFGTEAEAAVGIALQTREIVEQRRGLARRLLFLRDGAGLTQAFGADGVGFLLLPDTLGAGVFVGTLAEVFV